MATSTNLIDWTPVIWPDGVAPQRKGSAAHVDAARNAATHDLKVVQEPRSGMFDSGLVEGGVAVATQDGIVHIYNAGDADSPSAEQWKKTSWVYYSVGQALHDANDPMALLQRTDSAFLGPDREYEVLGAVPNVVYCTGLAYFKDKWWLFYNGADWLVGVATADGTALC